MVPTFTKATLAGTSYQGLFGSQLYPLYQRQVQEITDSKKGCQYTQIILGILTALAAIGGIALLAWSHGVHDLTNFIPGLVLGVSSVGFMIFMMILALRAHRNKEEALKAYSDEANRVVSLDQITEEFLKDNTTEAIIRDTLSSIKEEERHQILNHAIDLCSTTPFTEPKKKVFCILSDSWEDKVIGIIQERDRCFALTLLKNLINGKTSIDIKRAIYKKIGLPTNADEGRLLALRPFYVDLQMKALSDQERRSYALAILQYADPDQDEGLQQLIVAPLSDEEGKILLRHPQVLLAKMQAEGVNKSELRGQVLRHILFIFTEDPPLDKQQRDIQEWWVSFPEMIEIVQEVGRDLALTLLKIKELKPNLLPTLYVTIGQPTNEDEGHLLVSKLESVRTHKATLSKEGQKQYAQAILKYAHPDQDQMFIQELITPPNSKEEAEDILRHPLSLKILLKKEGQQELSRSLLQHATLTDEEMIALIVKNVGVETNTASQILPYQQTFLKKIETEEGLRNALDLMECVEVDESLILAIKQPESDQAIEIYAKHPRAMARIASEKNFDNLDAILEKMQPKARATFLAQLSTEKITEYRDVFKIVFKKRVLEKKGDELKKSLKNPFALAYFKAYPEEFTLAVLENGNIGEVQNRKTLALDILEKLEKDAKSIIETMDQTSTFGNIHFNALANILFKEAQEAKKSTKRMRDSRSLLMANFRYARLKESYLIDGDNASWAAQKAKQFGVDVQDDRLLKLDEREAFFETTKCYKDIGNSILLEKEVY